MNSNSSRIAVVCESIHHGNTRRVAEEIAHALHANVLSTHECDQQSLDDCNLVGFGSGIYFGRHHRLLRKFAAEHPSLPKYGFIFSTSGLPCFQSWWHLSLRRILAARGCYILGEFSCRGWDTVGPLALMGGLNRRHPNRKDLAEAELFAQRIRQQYEFWADSGNEPRQLTHTTPEP